MLFALCTITPLVTQRDLYFIARAIEPQAQLFAKIWGLEEIAIEPCASPDGLREFCQPVICTDRDELNTGFNAYHQPDRMHRTLARAFVQNATGILDGDTPAARMIAHEIWEAAVDPMCDLWTHAPGRLAGVQLAYEVSDPVQDGYRVQYDGKTVAIENFVYPAYFEDRYADPDAARAFRANGGKFDHLGKLERAGMIGPSGYAVFKDDSGTWLENAWGRMQGSSRPGAAHPAARTLRRIGR